MALRAFGSVLVLCLCCHHTDAQVTSQITSILQSVKTLTEGLGVDKFQEHLNSKGTFAAAAVDGSAIADKLAEDISGKLLARSDVIRRIVQAIEDDYARFTVENRYHSCCKITYIKKDAWNAILKDYVDLNKICFRVAQYNNETERFPTTKLVDTCVANYQRDPNTLWQYYGTVNGYFYEYPAVAGVDCRSYDPRLRPWFGGSIAFRKLMVVVMDDSSGMADCKLSQGENCLEVMTEMIDTLLNTLSSNDLMAFLTFDSNFNIPSQIDGEACYGKGFFAASYSNQQTVINFIKEYKYSGNQDSKYSRGIKGVTQLVKEQITDTFIVVFITAVENSESSTDKLGTALDELKTKVSNPVLMTYHFGKASTKTVEHLSFMPDFTSRGVFAQVIEKDDIYVKLGDFYKGVAKKENIKPIVTQPYTDFGDSDHVSILTTVCMPAFGNNQLVGVAGVDVTLTELFTEVIEFEKSKSYAFVIDKKGMVLIHPFLPKPAEYSLDFTDIRIETLETDKNLHTLIFERMKKQESGDVNLMAPSVTSRGQTSREGISVAIKNLTYHFRPVNGTDYSACVVNQEDDAISTYSLKEQIPKDNIVFTYHDTKVQNPNAEFCKQFFSRSVKGASGVKFSAFSFLDPLDYSGRNETQADVNLYEQIIKGDARNDNFTTGIVETVKLLNVLESLWAETEATYAGFRYIGTQRGVFRLYPGINLAKKYNPTNRHWYRRAVNRAGDSTLSAPYLDPFGAGYIVTVSKTVFESKDGSATSRQFGVMGMDFPVHYFYQAVLSELDGCSGDYSCFLVDEAGYFIAHPSWFDGEWEANPQYENVFIAKLEWDIANDLLAKNHLKQSKCVGVSSNNQTLFYEFEDDSASHINGQPYYEYERMAGTNALFFRKNVKKSVKTVKNGICKCSDTRECDKTAKCQCPCETPVPTQRCTGKAIGYTYACTIDVPTPLYKEKGAEDELAKLSPCFDHKCDEQKNDKDCHKYSSCRWCQWGKGGSKITAYCGKFDDCYYGIVGSASPYGAPEKQSSGVRMSVTSLLTIVVIVFLTRYL